MKDQFFILKDKKLIILGIIYICKFIMSNNNDLNEVDDEIVLEDVLDEIEEYF